MGRASSVLRTAALTIATACVAFVGVAMAPANADGATRYVATTGTDSGDCSSNGSPCLTINYAVSQAVAGDTVQVAAGSYPEMVTVNKSLVFLGANAGVPAGVSPGGRSAESVVKGFRSPGTPHPTSAYSFSATVDGFTLDPQGDATLIAAGGRHLVSLFGGPDVKVQNNIFNGGPWVPDCGYTCTTMTDAALFIQSGTFVVSANTFTNFRAPIDISQNNASFPIVSGTVASNSFTHVTNRAIWLRQGGGVAAAPTFPGVTVSGNVFDATGWTSLDWSPGGVIITTGGNNVTGNSFTGFGSGVFTQVCDGGNPIFTATNTFTDNDFQANSSGIQFFIAGTPCTNPVNAEIHGNDFVGNTNWGVRWNGVTGFVPPNDIDATCNWWGTPDGANSVGADKASAGIITTPWDTASGGPCDGGVVPTADHFSLSVAGGGGYSADVDLSGGDLRVRKDGNGVVSVTGSGTYVGPNSPAASIAVSINRIWILPLWLGTVRVNDGSYHLNGLMLFPSVAPTATGSVVNGSWLQFSSFPWGSGSLSLNVSDLV